MADALMILGGIAAGAQMLRYGFALFMAASAFFHHLSGASMKIQTWKNQSSAIDFVLDDLESQIKCLNPALSSVFEQCRNDALQLRTILQPFSSENQNFKQSRLKILKFRMCKELEIDMIIASIQRGLDAIHKVATSSIVHTVNQIRARPQVEERSSNNSNLRACSVDSLHKYRIYKDVYHVLSIICYLHTSAIPTNFILLLIDPNSSPEVLATLLSDSFIYPGHTADFIIPNHDIQTHMRLKFRAKSATPGKLVRAIRTLEAGFPSTNFAAHDTFIRICGLEVHVFAVFEAAMEHPAVGVALINALGLAIRFCINLMVLGHVLQAKEFVWRFQHFCRMHTTLNTGIQSTMQAVSILPNSHQTVSYLAVDIAQQIGESTSPLDSMDLNYRQIITSMMLVFQALKRHQPSLDSHCKTLATRPIVIAESGLDVSASADNGRASMASQDCWSFAEEAFSRSLGGWLRDYDANDLTVIATRSNLAIKLHFEGKLDAAEDIHCYAYTERRRILGDTHHQTLKSKANLAITINETGRHSHAEMLYREVLAAFQKHSRHSPDDILKTQFNLATALHDQGKYKEAENILTTSTPLWHSRFGEFHPDVVDVKEFRAILLHHMADFAHALVIATEVYEARKHLFGFDHGHTQRSLEHVKNLREDCKVVLDKGDIISSLPVSCDVEVC